MKKLARGVWAATTLALLSCAVWADEVGRAQVHFVVEPQTLREALIQWAQQAGLSVIWPAGQMEAAVITPRVAGELPAEQALQMLLEGSGLTYSFVDSQTVAIRAAQKAAAKRIAWLNGQSDQTAELEAEPFARLAKTGAGASDQPQPAGLASRQGQQAAVEKDELEEVIVTGTHIKGVTSSPSPIHVYGRKEIDRASAGNLSSFIKRIPQNFGNISDDTAGGTSGGAGATNETGGTGVNLRGLGTDSTLVLLNGRRLASSDSDGSFTDISLIPLNALERVEVLTDGASAIYGSDAVGGVINFILRRDFDKPETRVRYGSVASGNSHDLQLGQTAGLNWNGGSALLSYEFNNQTPLDSSDRGPPISGPFAAKFSLLPQQRRHGALLTAHHDLAEGLEAFSDTTWGKRSLDRDEVVFAELKNAVADVDVWSTTLGARKEFAQKSNAELSASYSGGRQHFEENNITTSAAEIARNTETSVVSVDATFNGVLFSSGAGPARFAVGGQYRNEEFDRKDTLNNVTSFGKTRDVVAGFVEMRIPLLGSVSRASNRLEVVLADRYEKYSDFGDSNNPTFGAIWRPTTGISLRGTYGTSFKAPLLENLDPRPVQIFALGLPDPAAACGECGITDTILIAGNNSDLKPEKATSWTAGIDLRPENVPGLSIAATYYNILYKDRIVAPIESIFFFDALLNEGLLGPSIVLRNPAASTISAIAGDPIFQDFRTFTGSSGLGFAAIADYRLHNLSQVHTSGIDLSLAHSTGLPFGSLEAGIEGTYILQLDRKFSPGAPTVESVSTPYNPVDLRLRAHAVLEVNQFSFAAYLSYVDSYGDNRGAGVPQPIDSWLIADLSAGYSANSQAGLWSGISVLISVNNIADEAPPIVANPLAPVNFDGTNASALGRFFAVQVSKRW